MKMRALFLALACVACDRAEPQSEATPEATPAVWVELDHPLHAEQIEWGIPLPTFFDVEELPGTEINAACGAGEFAPGTGLHGCVMGSTIYLRAELSNDLKKRAKLHEYGHAATGDRGHLLDGVDCPEQDQTGHRVRGEHLMCTAGNASGEVTARDLLWAMDALGLN